MEPRKRRKMLVAAVAKPVAITENVLTFQVEDVGAKAEMVTDKVFSISLVTDCIFRHLTTSDLLSNCSLVSTIWNSAVKEYLHRCRICLFHCNLDDFNGLQIQLEIIKNRLQSNIPLPFRGINVVIKPRVARLLKGNTKKASRLKLIVEDIISLIDMTYTVIEVTKHGHHWHEREFDRIKTLDFPGDLDEMLSNVLFPLLSTAQIQHLSFERFGRKNFKWETWFENVENGGFSALEIIPYISQQTDFVRNYKALLRTCPKLKEMPMGATFDVIMTFDKYNKLPLLKRLTNTSSYNEISFDNAKYNALAKAKDILEIVELGGCSDWSPKQFVWIGQILLLNSNSLQEVRVKFGCRKAFTGELITTCSYENIFQINFPPMPFVKEVRVVYTGKELNPLDNDDNFRCHPHLKKIFPVASILPEYWRRYANDCIVTLIIKCRP